ncbi:hypothetical protein ABEG61_12645 [Pantoea agglomerans]|uniref:hypothetical protein n=1 Tax=Enterobacter agglomerans TaxID=549 RepID=UPI003209473D
MKDDRVMTLAEMLHIMRHGEGFCGWGADQHTVNHFGDHVWFEKIPGGYTECCIYGEECPHHAKLREQERKETVLASEPKTSGAQH